jgi:folate-binding protein YgfZ
MARQSPLRPAHELSGAAFRPYGPPEAGIDLVEAFGPVEAEYAAIRKGAAVIDLPHRATLEIRGADRIAFLNRMVTQELKGLRAFEARRSFWLNRKGRIDADLRLIELPDRLMVDLDAHAADRTLAGLLDYVFSEDVKIEDKSVEWHRIGMHGPMGERHLASIAQPQSGPAPADLAPGQACIVTIDGRECILDRQDSTASPGFELLCRTGDARHIYSILTPEPDVAQHASTGTPDLRLARPIGWHAYNVARIEAGWPMYYIDFGPDSLPHETGVLHDRVSFKKGCYLGQEVVARMESLGHPKQKLVGLKVIDEEGPTTGSVRQPRTGAPVLFINEPEASPEAVVGAVTSSAVSPMLGAQVIAFAMVKFRHAAAGSSLFVQAEDESGVTAVLPAQIQESLVFWKR